MMRIKIITIVIVLLFGNICSYSQSCEESFSKVLQLAKEGKIKEAIVIGEEVLSKCKIEIENGSEDYANVNALMGWLYNKKNNFTKAEHFYLIALEIKKKILGAENLDYAILVNELASLYNYQNKFLKAEPLLLEVLAIRKKALGTENLNYASSLSNLAILYSNEGKYLKAEPLCKEALAIRRKVSGTMNLDYATSLTSLSVIYFNVGNYTKAEFMIKEALDIRKKILGMENPMYAASLNNLAYLYIEQGQYSKGEPLLLEALAIRKKILGVEDPFYAESINNLAVFYDNLGNLSKAEPLYLESLSILKKVFGTESSQYATSVNNLAVFYTRQRSLSKAEPFYLKALEIRKKVLGTNHPDYAVSLNSLSSYYKLFGSDRFLLYLDELLPLNQKQIIQQTNFQTTSELSAFLKANRYNFLDSKFSLVYPFNIINDTINYELYNTNILLKNLTLRNSTQLQNRIRESKDSNLINTLEEFHEIKRQLNKYAALLKANQPVRIKELENKAGLLEKKLVTGSQAFREAKEFTNTTWKNVQQSLKKDEVAIEFVSFQYLNNQWTDSIIYAAMIIRPGYAYPKIVPLFEQKQLDSLLKRNTSLPEENYLNTLYSKDNFSLYNLIVKPIDSLLQGVNTIYTAPSGSLYNINLSQIVSHKPDGTTFNVHVLGTTGELPRYSALQLNKSTISNEVVFGGVNYDTASNSGITFQPPTYTPGFGQVASVTQRGGANSWAYLPGTLTEAMQVGKISTQAGLKVTLLKGDQANETSFKNLNGFSSPYILHLATHGYFFPNPVQEKPRNFELMSTVKKTVYKWAQDPLLRSGLILAGANKAWKNSALMTDSTEDGILTSMEVANVDLSNCKLAVLSACETGLGDINGSEGVFGLQRGFKLAGVKNIIMSLWKIPDTQSAELLTLFYDNCFTGLTVFESLKQAQLVMSKKYPAFYWAGFMLLE